MKWIIRVLAMGMLAMVAKADSFNYSVSQSVSQVVGYSLVPLGTLDGSFSLSTTNVPFNYPGAYFCDGSPTCPLVTSAALVWTPIGSPSETLQIASSVDTFAGASDGFDFAIPCSFTAGEHCEFELNSNKGLLNFSGTLGQNLMMGLCAECLGSSYPNFVVDYQGTALDPVSAPEPSALMLVAVGLALLALVALKRNGLFLKMWWHVGYVMCGLAVMLLIPKLRKYKAGYTNNC